MPALHQASILPSLPFSSLLFIRDVGRSAGDFCDPDGLKRAYALHDDFKEPGTPRQKQRVSVPPLSNAAGRTPSYTDRILVSPPQSHSSRLTLLQGHR